VSKGVFPTLFLSPCSSCKPAGIQRRSPSNETAHVKRRPSQTVQTCTYLHLIYADIKILNYLFVRAAQTKTAAEADPDTDTLSLATRSAGQTSQGDMKKCRDCELGYKSWRQLNVNS